MKCAYVLYKMRRNINCWTVQLNMGGNAHITKLSIKPNEQVK